jgi:hypothetical protein
MKIPTPNFLIANPEFIIKSKITLWWLGNSFLFSYSILIYFYKRLNTNVCKRVLDEYKRLKSDNESGYQMDEKIIGIAPMGGLRI